MPHPARRNKNKNKRNKPNVTATTTTNVKAETAIVQGSGGNNNSVKPQDEFPNLNRNTAVRKGAVGTNAISAVQKWTVGLQPYELQFPLNMETFQEMYERDEAVGGVLNATYALVENAFSGWKMLSNSTSPDSVKTGKLLEHFFHNMRDSTMRQFSRNAATFNQFGFSVIEKDYRKFDTNTYMGELPSGVDVDRMWMVDKLRFIPQRSLDPSEPFVIGNDGRDILGMRQNAAWFINSTHALRHWVPTTNTVTIRRNKFMLMGINVTDSTPMGLSPLEQVWVSWKEKKFFENYLSCGVSKDMAGMPLLEIPQDILDKANIDPTSPEGLLVRSMAEDVASMHAGEQNMMIMPSDPFDQGSGSNKAYSLKFLGVDGGGRQFDIQEIINKRREAIYSSFGALNLISSESSGGYNQLEGQNSIHLYFVKRIIRIIEESINRDLIPQILKLNNIVLSDEDTPKFAAGEIEPISLEEFSKMIQRVTSVGQLPITKELTNEILSKVGVDYRLPSEMTDEEYDKVMADATSRSGEGDGTSGTGSTQSAGNENNMDNTA